MPGKFLQSLVGVSRVSRDVQLQVAFHFQLTVSTAQVHLWETVHLSADPSANPYSSHAAHHCLK